MSTRHGISGAEKVIAKELKTRGLNVGRSAESHHVPISM
jgi:hypothetical protein